MDIEQNNNREIRNYCLIIKLFKDQNTKNRLSTQKRTKAHSRKDERILIQCVVYSMITCTKYKMIRSKCVDATDEVVS